MHKVPAKLEPSSQSKPMTKKMAAHFSFLQMDSMGMLISCAVPFPIALLRLQARSPREICIRVIPTRLRDRRPELVHWLPRFCEAILRSALGLGTDGILWAVNFE